MTPDHGSCWQSPSWQQGGSAEDQGPELTTLTQNPSKTCCCLEKNTKKIKNLTWGTPCCAHRWQGDALQLRGRRSSYSRDGHCCRRWASNYGQYFHISKKRERRVTVSQIGNSWSKVGELSPALRLKQTNAHNHWLTALASPGWQEDPHLMWTTKSSVSLA